MSHTNIHARRSLVRFCIADHNDLEAVRKGEVFVRSVFGRGKDQVDWTIGFGDGRAWGEWHSGGSVREEEAID